MAKKGVTLEQERQIVKEVPAWVLMAKVDTDWEIWNQARVGLGTDDLEDEEGDDLIPFPEFDSTIKSLELLDTLGIKFDPKKGKWSS
jgi:hypothetical protein